MKSEQDEPERICLEFVCPAETTFQIIGGKWRPRILWQLSQTAGPQRFGEIASALDGISVKTLTHHLRELETMNLVVRQDFNKFPPKVEYSLTDFGKSLEPIFEATYDWVSANHAAVRQVINNNPNKDWLIRKDADED